MGHFSLPRKMFNNEPSTILDIMNGMIVLEANYAADTDSFSYLAISPKHFRGSVHGERAPEYLIAMDHETNEFKFEEVK